jgi:Nitrile hydratase beta subunit
MILRMTAAPPVDIIPRPPEDALPWEKLSVALVDILGGMQQVITVDELQRADKTLADSYCGLSSFERLTQTAVNVLVAKGLVNEGDLRVRMARLAVTLAGDKDRAHPRARFSNAGVNDIGGLPGGPIDRRHHEPADWEKLVVALSAVLSQRRLRTVHESRRAIEELGDDYNRLAYFERAVLALANLMYEKGTMRPDEVAARMDAIRKRLSK